MNNLVAEGAYADYVPNYVGLPLQQVDDLGKTLENKYYTNLNDEDTLSKQINNVAVENRNKPIVQQALSSFNDSMAEYVKNGNYEDAHRAIKLSANQFNSNPLIKSAVNSQAAASNWQKEMDDYDKNKDGNPDFSSYAKAMTTQANQEMLSIDSKTGQVKNSFVGYLPPKDLGKEAIDEAEKLAKSFKPDITTGFDIQLPDGKGGFVNRKIDYKSSSNGAPSLYFVTGTTEQVKEEDVRSALHMQIANSPRYAAYFDYAAKTQTWKHLAQTGRSQIDSKDFLGDKATGITGLLETKKEVDDFTTNMIALGADPVAVLNEPKILNIMYQNILKQHQIADLIEPTVQAAAYVKKDIKYHEDIMGKLRLESSLRFSLAEYTHRLKMQEDKVANAPFITNAVAGQVNPAFANKDLETVNNSVLAKQGDLRQAQIALDYANKTQPNTMAAVDALNNVNRLKNEVAAETGWMTSKVTIAVHDPNNAKLVANMYDKYVAERQRVGDKNLHDWGVVTKPLNSKAEFSQYLIDNPTLLTAGNRNLVSQISNSLAIASGIHPLKATEQGTLGSFMGNIQSYPNGNPNTSINQSQQSKDFISRNNGIIEAINTYEKQPNIPGGGNLPGFNYNVYADNAGKNSYLTPINKTLTDMANQVPESYSYVDKAGVIHDFKELYDTHMGNKDKKNELTVSFADANLSAGGVQRWANHAVIKDKLGDIVASVPIYNKKEMDGGVGTRINILQGLTNRFPKDSPEYNTFNSQLAEATLNDVIPIDIDKYTAGYANFNQNTSVQQVLDSNPKIQNAGGIEYKIIRRMIESRNNKSGDVSIQPMYSAVIVDANGKKLRFINNQNPGVKHDEVIIGTNEDPNTFNYKTKRELQVSLHTLLNK